MSEITFTVKGEPKAQARPKVYRNKYTGMIRAVDPSAEAKDDFRVIAEQSAPAVPWSGPVACFILAEFPFLKAHKRSNGELKPSAPKYKTSKPDADNIGKFVLDAMTGKFFEDDSQIVKLLITKTYSKSPCVSVTISEIES